LVLAQQEAVGSEPKRALSITPRASVALTYSDNIELGNTERHSDLLLALTAGVHVASEGGRVKGYFDYALTAQAYTHGNKRNSLQNALTTFGTVEAVDNLAFLDFNGSVSRQAISAFGLQSDGSPLQNANQTEVSTWRLSPYLRGKLVGDTDYEARYSWSNTHTGTDAVSDARVGDTLLKLNGHLPASRATWSAQASRQSVRYKTGRNTDADQISGTLNYPVSSQLVLSVTGGRDSNNYTNLGKEHHSLVGAGFTWTPAPTTSLSASANNQSFGHSHNINFEHRTPLTVWRFTDSNGVTNTPGQLITANVGSVYDLYFDQYASREPDPVKRAILVNTLLQTNGINPNTPVIAGFLSSAVLRQRRQDASLGLIGVRDTVTFLASRSNSRRLDTVSGAADDFLSSTQIVQQGLSVSYAHRLTPQTSLNAIASRQHTSGSGTQTDTNLRSLSLTLTSKTSQRSSASLGLRRSVFDSATSPYTESALSGSFNMQF
jgi:uncharacterized protein (PEP-CTERM system associated)